MNADCNKRRNAKIHDWNYVHLKTLVDGSGILDNSPIVFSGRGLGPTVGSLSGKGVRVGWTAREDECWQSCNGNGLVQ